MGKSLKSTGDKLADIEFQLEILSNGIFKEGKLPTFREKLSEMGPSVLKPSGLEVFQVNIGYMCNQTCNHCHVDAGPDRKEIMSRETMGKCLEVMEKSRVKTLDITGGAPEMNPHFEWFVEKANDIGVEEIIVRSNLTIIRANKKYYGLPEFFKKNRVRVISSLPYYRKLKTDRQRGDGVFDKSIEALKALNQVGYGKSKSGLVLDLVYNPTGAFLPGNQGQLEADFKRNLSANFGVSFNSLFTITNLPISRFLGYLLASGNYEDYMENLVNAFNPAAVSGVMCRNTISVDWKGFLYDCDFNQMLDMKVSPRNSQHLDTFDLNKLNEREIRIHQHCYGCTAGAGSSCQGTVA